MQNFELFFIGGNIAKSAYFVDFFIITGRTGYGGYTTKLFYLIGTLFLLLYLISYY